jgi:hypothetical protein
VLTGTEDFDCGKTRFPDPLEPDRRQAMFHEEVSGKYTLHQLLSQVLAEGFVRGC